MIPVLDVTKLVASTLKNDATLQTLFGGTVVIEYSVVRDTTTFPCIIIDSDSSDTYFNGVARNFSKCSFTIKVVNRLAGLRGVDDIASRIDVVLTALAIGTQGSTTYYKFRREIVHTYNSMDEGILYSYIVQVYTNVGF